MSFFLWRGLVSPRICAANEWEVGCMQEKRAEIRWRAEELHSCAAPALSAVCCSMYLSLNIISVLVKVSHNAWAENEPTALLQSRYWCSYERPIFISAAQHSGSEESLKWDGQLKVMHGKIYCGGITLLNKIKFKLYPHAFTVSSPVVSLASLISVCGIGLSDSNKPLWSWRRQDEVVGTVEGGSCVVWYMQHHTEALSGTAGFKQ